MSREDPADTDTHDPDTPSLDDRIDASKDFTAALDQSVGFVKQHRRLFIIFALAILFALGLRLFYAHVC